MADPYYIENCPGRGRGVFANKTYSPGDYILSFTGKQTPIHEITDFTHFLQIAPDIFLSPSGKADDYVNHSCDPNCAVYFESDGPVLRAITTIAPDQELSFDYGTIMFSEPTMFQCECGSPNCRGLIGNFYSLPEELRKKYQTENMVPLLSRYSLVEIQAAQNEEGC